jgi:hypothetical protein
VKKSVLALFVAAAFSPAPYISGTCPPKGGLYEQRGRFFNSFLALGAEQFVARSAVRRDREEFFGHFLSPLTGRRVGSWRPTAVAVGHLIPPLAGLSEG